MRYSSLAATITFSAFMLASASTVHAATCDESFSKKGSMIGGLTFTGTVTVPDLKVVTAIQQMRGIAAGKGYDIMADEAEYGSMLIEQPMTGKARAFPIQITASQAGAASVVVMDAKLRAGMAVKEEAARAEICAMLNAIVGGKAGLAAARRGAGAATVGAAPVKINALALSQQVSKDTERNAAGILTRYKGKQFTVDGQVAYVTKDGSAFRVGYKVPNPWEQALRLPGQAQFKTDIVCYMAPGQAAYSLQLKPDKTIKLTGTVEDFDEYKHIIWLKDCRPSQ